jgi:predicted exporter
LKRRRVWLVLLPLWLLVLAGLACLVTQRLQVGGDLRSFMPAPSTPDQRLLLDQVGEGAASRLLMLALSGRPEAQLARLSQQLAQRLRGDRRYTQVLNGGFEIDALDPRLLPYRYLLSPTLDTQQLDTAYLSDQLQQRLEDLSSPAASLLKGLLPRDPTLELLKLAQRWTPAQSPALRHGVWFSAQHEALLLVQTQAGGFDPAAQQAAVDGLRQALAALPDQAGVELTISGPGYFSMVAAAQTRQQAEWIGRISSAGFVLLLLLAYRNVGALLLSALPIASAALAGLAALVLIFPQVHGITLAFGFTLLGVAQEYPIRLLSHRRADVSALASARALWPPLLTAIASACIAYLAFYASGVNGLKQLAVFTIVGLLVAGLSTRYLLPHLLPRRVRDVAQLAWLGGARRWLDDLPRPRWIAPLLALAAAVMLWLAPGPFWQNDLSALTPLPRALLQRDAQLRAALGAPDARYLLLLRAPTEQGVLELSERLEPKASALIASHALDALELPSLYLPSLATQQARQRKLPERAALQASLTQATQGLPFRQQLFAPFVDDVALARQLPLLTPQRYAQSPLGQRLAAMLLPYDDQWLGLAMISGLHDPLALQRLADASGGQLRLLDMKGAAESLVATYRKRILQALLVAGVLLIVTIAVSLRSLRRAWHVLAPMTLATFLVLAVERVAGVEISLFHLVAMMLAGGLGLHYALFFERDGADPAERRRTLHATVVCAVSALLVFGMLAWASIPVLRAIGLTVSLGVAFHFCLSVLMAAPASSAVAKEGSAP